MKCVFTIEKIKEYISKGLIDKIKGLDSRGNISNIYDFSPFLIKVENHYVPAEYYFYDDTANERNSDLVDDVCTKFPHIFFDKESNKWIIEFASANFGGYDVEIFRWYYDSLDDIIKELQK